MSDSSGDEFWDDIDESMLPETFTTYSTDVLEKMGAGTDISADQSGMVTITPAMADSRPPVHNDIVWVHGGDEVLLFGSYDDFEAGLELKREEDPETGQVLFTGVVSVTPGKYLIRFMVDGEWAVDEDQPVIMSLGNEYNTLMVDDPNAPADDLDDLDDLDDDEDVDFGDGDGDRAAGGDGSAGGDAAGGDGETAGRHSRRGSLQWDPVQSRFTVGDKSSGGGDKSGGGSRKLTEEERRERRRRKRRRYRQRKKLARKKKNMLTSQMVQDTEVIRQEVVKREREWREAWMRHEAEMQALRQEKETMRQQWKEERVQWIAKIKSYASEAATLRTKYNEASSRIEVAESSRSVAEKAASRQQSMKDEHIVELNAAVDKAKKEAAGAKEEARAAQADLTKVRDEFNAKQQEWQSQAAELRAQQSQADHKLQTAERNLADATAKLEAATQKLKDQRAEFEEQLKAARASAAHGSAELQQEMQQLRDAESKSKLALESVQRELEDAKRDNKSLEERLAKQRDELEKKVADALQDAENTRQAAHKDTETVQSQLNERIATLTAEAATQSKALQAAEDANKETAKQLAAVTRDHAAAKSELEAVKKQVETERKERQETEQRLNQANGALETKLESANKQLAESTVQVERLEKELSASKALADGKSADLAAAQDKAASLEESVKQRDERIAQLQADLAAARTAKEATEKKSEEESAALTAELDKARESTRAKQAEMDAVLTQLDDAKSQLERSQSTWKREKEDLELSLEQARSAQAGLGEKVLALSKASSAMREILEGFRGQVRSDMTELSSSLQGNKKFMLQSIRAQSKLLSTTMKKYKKEMSLRRKYFNLVQELRGNIRVFCRCRPMLPIDAHKKTKECVSFPDEGQIVVAGTKRTAKYEFDKVFAPGSTQEQVFKETKWLVQSCMDGYNVCIFAYGQTGTGKTYTMEGSPDDRGVNYRALHELFRIRDERKDEYAYKISVSMMEIYNETIRDLLDSKGGKKDHKIHKGPNGMYVDGLTEFEVDSDQDVIDAMKKGQSNRSTGVTNMNEHSSRSHMLLSVKVVGHNVAAGITYYGKLHLIDLAGSERVGKSGATGQRLKEAQAINKSLSALGNVIEALQQKSSHVPYRNSKLTYLLADSLGGHAKTLMFINTSPTESDSGETFCSLEFATRVGKVELGKASKTTSRAGSSRKKTPKKTSK